MRYVSITIAFLLLAAATAPVLAQQSSLTMVRNAGQLVTPDSIDISPGPVHFLRGSDAAPELPQGNGFGGFGLPYKFQTQPVHFLMPHSYAHGLLIILPAPTHVQRTSALGELRHHRPRH